MNFNLTSFIFYFSQDSVLSTQYFLLFSINSETFGASFCLPQFPIAR